MAENKRIAKSNKYLSKKSNSIGNKDPFDELKIVAFNFSAKNRADAAYKQYNLLLKPEILQAHLNFDSKKGKIICIPAFDVQKDLADFGIKLKLSMVEWITYKEYQKRNAFCAPQ
ncbi:MAG: hypothetical protein WCI04_01760 [archaeon]